MSIFIYCNPPNALLSKKAIPTSGISGYEYELPIHLITAYISFALVRVLRAGAFAVRKSFFKNFAFPFGIDTARPWKAAERG